MACSSFLLLLLVAHGVSAHRERHYVYHVHSLHFNPLLNTSLRYMEQAAAVLFDGKQINYYSGGKNMASARMERTWRRKTSITPERQILQNEFEGFHNLLEISSHGVHHFIKRYGCVIERSNREAFLLKSTAEYRHNGKTILYFNVQTDHWEVQDMAFLPVKLKWDRFSVLNQITKEYLLQGCMEKLLQYLEARDRNELTDSQILAFFTDSPDDSSSLRGRRWSLWVLTMLSMGSLVCCILHRRRRCSLCSLAGAICSCCFLFKKRRRRSRGKDAYRESEMDMHDDEDYDEDEDSEYDEDDEDDEEDDDDEDYEGL